MPPGHAATWFGRRRPQVCRVTLGRPDYGQSVANTLGWPAAGSPVVER